ncbi:hypothetical protein [Pseudoalteromonas sp. T1lg75]|uniref:hypothetical protein n=1 Tax=Pseudoalteromonas sp. T1lg75 TaxID=2077102 RepID=UPI000CF66AD8|nr:hypothetical protein [Pseudoalteromonas sp. T1lg75]
MKKLLISPSKMALAEQESQIYQNILKQAADISLNLMAVKVENHPEDFLGWAYELLDVVTERLNFDLLEPTQLPTVKKLQAQLKDAISFLQLKTLRIAPWPVICAYLEQHKERVLLDEHLSLAEHIASIKETPLQEMSKEDRLTFVGKHTAAHDPAVYRFDVEFFAGTKNNKAFAQILDDQPQAVEAALAHIPLTDEVSLEHYQAFVLAYLQLFTGSDDKPTLAPATRLLAMRRPDVFTPITNAKSDTLCAALNVTRLNNRDFERYWQDIVSTLARQPWFAMAQGDNEQEQRLVDIKALLPCLFYYFDKNAMEQSNYFKLLHKPKASPASANSTARKRSKESAALLVDRALAEEGMPEHIRAKRDSIISEVEKGRSVADTISLMRAIFG